MTKYKELLIEKFNISESYGLDFRLEIVNMGFKAKFPDFFH